jgi:peptidoglycan/xylan/chitin deacetylase (PgdA/CDA1 family)
VAVKTLRLSMTSDALVLAYHAVSEQWPSKFSVAPTRLREQVESLLRRGYTGMTFGDAVRAPAGTKAVALTFDDCYRSVFELALPILSELGVPATVFAVTDAVGSEAPLAWAGLREWLGGPFEGELKCMSWEELEQLVGAGWEVGSHTRSHPALTELDDASLAREVGGSREACEHRLSRPCRSFAYPYGDFDDRVVQAAREAGYDAAATFGGRSDLSDPFKWPRVPVLRSDSGARFRFKVSPWTRRLRASFVWTAAGAGRRIIRRAGG